MCECNLKSLPGLPIDPLSIGFDISEILQQETSANQVADQEETALRCHL